MSNRWLVLLLAGCAFEPPNEEVFQPPAEYRVWFQAVATCAGIRADFDRITWIKADLVGYAGHRQGNTVWIDRDYLDNQYVVSHESLHVILDGDGKHHAPEWTRCL